MSYFFQVTSLRKNCVVIKSKSESRKSTVKNSGGNGLLRTFTFKSRRKSSQNNKKLFMMPEFVMPEEAAGKKVVKQPIFKENFDFEMEPVATSTKIGAGKTDGLVSIVFLIYSLRAT